MEKGDGILCVDVFLRTECDYNSILSINKGVTCISVHHLTYVIWCDIMIYICKLAEIEMSDFFHHDIMSIIINDL